MRTFTFGFVHKHPVTGASLARHYIQVPGEDDLSRRFMNAVFGRGWAMQYKDPSKLKYLERMTELKWTTELLALISADDRDVLESVVGESLEKHFGLEPGSEVKKNLLVDAYFDTLKARDPKELDALQAEAHVGEAVTEYSLKMLNTMQVLPTDTEVEKVYPMAKHLRHSMKFGGQVYRRRLLIIEDWTPVTEEEVNELCKPYEKAPADLVEKLMGPKGTQLP